MRRENFYEANPQHYLQTNISAHIVASLVHLPCQRSHIPNHFRTAILTTDWGTPDGMDKDYFIGVVQRSRYGFAADPNIPR